MPKFKQTVERSAQRESRCRTEMYKSYKASEWLLKEKIDNIGFALYVLHKEARMFDVTEEYFKEFIHEKLIELIDQSLKENIEKYQGKTYY